MGRFVRELLEEFGTTVWHVSCFTFGMSTAAVYVLACGQPEPDADRIILGDLSEPSSVSFFISATPECAEGYAPLFIELAPNEMHDMVSIDCGRVQAEGEKR